MLDKSKHTGAMLKILLIFLIGLAPVVSRSQGALKVIGYSHVGLQVKDIAVSAKFYGDLLGLPPVEVPDNLKAIRAWFKIGFEQQLHLLAGPAENRANDRNGTHYAFFVASIAQTEQYLQSQKYPYHRQVRFDGLVQIFVIDPDGYVLEFNELVPPK